MSGVLSDLVKGAAKAGASWFVPGSSPFIFILDELRSSEYQRRFDDFKEKVDEQLRMMKDVQLQQLKDNFLRIKQTQIVWYSTKHHISLQYGNSWPTL